MQQKVMRAIGSAIVSKKALPTAGPYPTNDPLLFCVYHKDEYPAATDDTMEAPRVGNGSDFDPSRDYRMYHGRSVPGFPRHPHRGFETVTATIDGIIDHADSAGNGGRYGQGDLQWMTAGRGIVHSEMFPLLHKDRPNHTRFFQIWLNLPARNKMAKPAFAMFWADTVPIYESPDRSVKATMWVGHDYLDLGPNPNNPPPDSWAADRRNDVVICHVTVQPGGTLVLPSAHVSSVNRSLYYIEGHGALVDGTVVNDRVHLTLDPTVDEVVVEVPTSEAMPSEFLWMQGRPIEEPKVSYGPFVMNTEQEIYQAFRDYEDTQFGGWPWPRDDMVFPRDKGRFALFDGIESTPHNGDTNNNNNKKKEEEDDKETKEEF